MTTAALQRRIDEVLGSLPAQHVCAGQGSARLVVGPNGAFVIQPVLDEIGRAAEALHRLVTRTRDAIYDHLTLVPFLDAVAVTASEPTRRSSVTTVPLDLLADLLRQGPVVIDGESLTVIRGALRAQQLDGWQVAYGDAARAALDLRETAVHPR